jgi:deazaflavin-dependent oxidoreductase (nitroreductase family)
MTQPPLSQRWWHRLSQRLGTSRVGARAFARTLHLIDRPILRFSRDRFSLTSLLAGLPVVLLTTTGAKSGKPRTLPVLALTDGPNIVLIASNYGQTRHPAWYHNLRAHPEATLSLRGRSGQYIAREVTGAERDQYWRRAVAYYRGYAIYEDRTGGRRIPVLVLTPKDS